MNTKEVAQKWAKYCQEGTFDKAYQELYDQNCVSLEMKGYPGGTERAEGMEAIAQKGEKWNSMVEQFHGVEIEGPIVAGNHFTATMKMDITMKGQPRNVDEEICVFKVENGKIVQEQFFYAV